jgi:hypothetical protein
MLGSLAEMSLEENALAFSLLRRILLARPSIFSRRKKAEE